MPVTPWWVASMAGQNNWVPTGGVGSPGSDGRAADCSLPNWAVVIVVVPSSAASCGDNVYRVAGAMVAMSPPSEIHCEPPGPVGGAGLSAACACRDGKPAAPAISRPNTPATTPERSTAPRRINRILSPLHYGHPAYGRAGTIPPP